MTAGPGARRGARGLRRPALRLRPARPDHGLGEHPAQRVVHAEPLAADLRPAARSRPGSYTDFKELARAALVRLHPLRRELRPRDRHRDARAAARRSRWATRTSTSSRSAGTRCCAGSTGRARCCTSCGRRSAPTARRSASCSFGPLDAAVVRRAGERHLPGEGDVLPEPVAGRSGAMRGARAPGSGDWSRPGAGRVGRRRIATLVARMPRWSAPDARSAERRGCGAGIVDARRRRRVPAAVPARVLRSCALSPPENPDHARPPRSAAPRPGRGRTGRGASRRKASAPCGPCAWPRPS